VLAAFYKIGATDLELVAIVLGVGCAGITAVAVYGVGLITMRTTALASMLAVITGLHGFVSGWATSGMETTFYTALVAVFVARFYFRRVDGPLTTALLCAIALSRVEGLAFVGGVLLTNALRVLGGRLRRALVVDAVVVVVVVGAAYVFRHAYYGTWLPHSYMMKTINQYYKAQPDILVETWTRHATPMVVVAVGGMFAMRRDARCVGLVATIFVSTIAFLRGPIAHFSRYSLPLFPVLMMLTACALGQMWSSRALRGFVLVTLGWFGLLAKSSFVEVRDFHALYAPHQACRREIALWVNQNQDAAKLIMSADLGIIAYNTPKFRFVDLFGLTSASVLGEYLQGRSADAVLRAHKPLLVVDTYYPSYQAVRLLQGGAGLKGIPPSQLLSEMQIQPAIKTCVASNFTFAVAPIKYSQ